ncbi:hypothetical protein [Hyphobacterium marinum]|uniref:Uncharacterized protein n=1 Tax=Hyphobacterium marinum TaxID=3116574 RepID=A0ABU7LWT2_9PROT|nr:hypothetical protein [Hyphobacterium sp. Y6023]MEE2565985.1 hypothetical protein [Hyphobacterium sp. Y6023]
MVDVINAGFPTNLFRMEVGEIGILENPHIGGRCLAFRANASGGNNNVPIGIIIGKFRDGDRNPRPYWVHANELDDGWGSEEVIVFPKAKIRVDINSLVFVNKSQKNISDSAIYMAGNRGFLKALPIKITGDRGNFLLSGRLLQRDLPGPSVAYESWSVIVNTSEIGTSEEILFKT